jgi:hypothetical protein
VAAAEATERSPDRGGRPRAQPAKPSGQIHPLGNGVSMERILHSDGYSIRLRGRAVDVEMVDLLMEELRRLLSKL